MPSRTVRRIPPIVYIQSLLVAFFADIKCINLSLVYGGYTSEGIMSYLYLVVVLFTLVLSFLGNKLLISRFSALFVCLVLWLFGFYFYTLYFIGKPHTTLPMFLIFVIFALLIPNLLVIDARILIKGIMIFPFFAIFRRNLVFSPISDWSDVISMDTSYAFLVPIIATVGYLFLFFRDENRWAKAFTIVLSLINFYFFTQILQYGSRGPLLCVFSFLAFLLVVKWDNKGIVFRRGALSFGIIGLLIIAFSFTTVVSFTNSVFESKGIQIHALEKILRLDQEGDITNGREMINAITLDGIREKPIFGHGLDRFDANTGLLYPHNFLLQILYDGGVVLLIFLLFPIISRSIQLLKTCNRGEYAVFVVLFFSSVPGAFFSGDLWGLARLWLFFGFALSKSFVYESSLKNTIS